MNIEFKITYNLLNLTEDELDTLRQVLNYMICSNQLPAHPSRDAAILLADIISKQSIR